MSPWAPAYDALNPRLQDLLARAGRPVRWGEASSALLSLLGRDADRGHRLKSMTVLSRLYLVDRYPALWARTTFQLHPLVQAFLARAQAREDDQLEDPSSKTLCYRCANLPECLCVGRGRARSG